MNPPAVNPQINKDEEHLKLLSVFHYVVGGMIGLFACIPLIHVTVGLIFVFAPESMENSGDMPPAAFGWMFVGIGAFCSLMGWTLATLVIAAGRKLSKRKSRTFCIVVAGILCAFAPIGTVLGVFTIMVLLRESVKPLFEDGSQSTIGAGA